MITKNTIKHIRSLALKKHRDATRTFVAEGPKAVGDLLPLLRCQLLCLTGAGRESFSERDLLSHVPGDALHLVSPQEMERMSGLKTSREALAVFCMPDAETDMDALAALPATELCLALDGVQDPGNLGTIIRIADWFGISHIFASPDTADAFAPKVVQATMGAIGRVSVHYTDLPALLSRLGEDVPVYGTFLDGSNMYAKELGENGLVVMGNEGKGISPEVAAGINRRLFIPNFPAGRATSESLNVAVATAVVCAEFRRRMEM